MRSKFTLVLCILAMASFSTFGGGYQVRLQGQKQTGIGLIGTPLNFGASSIFYNPGALTMIKQKYNFSLGVSGIQSNHVFQKENTNIISRTDNPLSTPFYAYGSGKITENLTAGIGVYTPFGSSANWGDDWEGRYLIQEISLQAIFIQPTISYKFCDFFSLGAGFIFSTGTVELNKAIDPGTNANVNLNGSATAIGYNIGAYFIPFKGFTFGIDYRSEIEMKVEGGDATFEVPQSLSGEIPAQNKFDATLPMPANLDFGLAYQFNEKLTLAFEVNWVMWSTYDSLIFTFEKAGDKLNSRNPREYKDSWIVRLGGEYKLNNKLTFRAGGYYDPAPTNEKYFTPETVSLNTIAFTLGLSYQPLENLSIDLSYLQLHGMEDVKSYEPNKFTGTYKTQTYIPGIGISYSF